MHLSSSQAFGQGPARRLAPLERLHRHPLRCGDLLRGLGLALILLEREQLQLELIEQRLPLRRLPEPLMLKLGDPVLQLLNQRKRRLGVQAVAGFVWTGVGVG